MSHLITEDMEQDLPMKIETRRPRVSDKGVIERAAKYVYATLKPWRSSNDYNKVTTLQELEALLTNMPVYGDGYALAKRAEGLFNWPADSELVALLDGAWVSLHDALRDATARWIRRNKIVPKFKEKDFVQFKCLNGSYIGTIIRVHDDIGEYIINCPALGHVPIGKIGTNGICKTWEEIEEQNGIND